MLVYREVRETDVLESNEANRAHVALGVVFAALVLIFFVVGL